MARTLAALAALAWVSAQASGADDADVVIHRSGVRITFAQMVSDLAHADVICVGEQHDHQAGHEFELKLLDAVGREAKGACLSLEMFERDVQVVLDEYVNGHITESAFLAASRPWPRYKTDYGPLIEWCRENKAPVIAANVPRRYVNMVSRSGQESLRALPRASRAWLPRLPYTMDISPAYNLALTELFGAPHGAAPGIGSPENMIAAQGLWDHGMAEGILHGLRRMRRRPVVHMRGSMHCERGFGIVERLRKASPRTKILTVIVRPTPGPDQGAPAVELGDFVVTCGPAAAQTAP
jgi:uncharacterized iron-regulated protein